MERNVAVRSISTHEELQHEQAEGTDPLAPARGIVIGLVLSAVFWGCVALIATRIFT